MLKKRKPPRLSVPDKVDSSVLKSKKCFAYAVSGILVFSKVTPNMYILENATNTPLD